MKNTILKFSLILCFVATSIVSSAQWKSTSIKGLYDMTEHNNTVYAAVGTKIMKLDKSNGEWNEVTSTGRDGYNVRWITSHGESLFIVEQYQGCASSMVYRSDDDGATFVEDTAGLPVMTFCDTRLQTIYDIESLNGIVVVSVSTGRYVKRPGSDRWIGINHNVKFSQKFAEYKGTTYGYYQNFYKSTDTAKTWSITEKVGLDPGTSTTKILFVNQSTGRIYLAAGKKMFYSDDEGDHWDTLAISKYFGKSYGGWDQEIMAAGGFGTQLYIGLDNDKNGTHPDLLYSTDNGVSWSVDTAGLPISAPVTTVPVSILFSNNVVYLALDQAGIFTKGTATSSILTTDEPLIKVYPNPSNGPITIQHHTQIISVLVYSLEGKKVEELIDFDNSPTEFVLPNSGIFLLRITDINNQVYYSRIIRN